MLFATELMGAQVFDAQGHYVGRVREFFVEPAEQPNRVAHFLISRGRFQPLVAHYEQVASVQPGRIDLNVSERALDAYQPNEAWLAVRKDLLDQQIIDTAGRKVVRVNDVDLAELRANGTVELRIACRGQFAACSRVLLPPLWCGVCKASFRSAPSVGSSSTSLNPTRSAA